MEEDDIDYEKLYHSVTFIVGSTTFNSWTTYRLVASSRPVVAPPEPKTNFVDVPGADGSLDFTTALDGHVHYGQRTGSFEFYVVHEEIRSYNWATLWRDLLRDLHGKYCMVSLADESDGEEKWYYFGRVWLSTWQSDPSHSKVVVNYNLEPYRYRSTDAHDAGEGGVL